MNKLDRCLGDYVKFFRKDVLGFTQPKFGEAINKYPEDISKIECGKQMLKIPEWLLLAEEYNNPLFALIALGLDKLEELKYNQIYDFDKIKMA